MIKVLHLTAHLGGGVGKALSGLVLQAILSGSKVLHTIVTFEKQEKTQFIELITKAGGNVFICPTADELAAMIEVTDIVQLEWWNHPLILNAVCSNYLPSMRLLVWSHVSGLNTPHIPPDLMMAAHQFIFTSACSFEMRGITNLPDDVRERLGVVSSSGGFDGFPMPKQNENDPLCAGYIGSLNFAKLHPRYVEYLAAVKVPDFKVKLIGDVVNQEILEQQCRQIGRSDLLEFRGYTNDVATELTSINVLPYLLNPEHYGTTENALIEAMSMGIVPIVLDNPAERLIVEDSKTGIIVDSPKEFADAIHWLKENPKERLKIGVQAADSVRERFTVQHMETVLNEFYLKCIIQEKKTIHFSRIFGTDPAEWFLACQGYPAIFSEENCTIDSLSVFSSYGLFEQSKGTVFHFLRYFSENKRLGLWAKRLLLLK